MDGEYVEIGRILKPFGIKGGLRLRLFIDEPGDIEGLKSFFIRDKKTGWRELVFKTLQFEEAAEFALAFFPEIPDRTAAEIWRQVPLFIPKSQLPLPQDSFFVGELIGCEVFFQGEALGVVDNHINVAAKDMLVVKTAKDMLVIPMTERYIEKIDTSAKQVVLINADELF